MREDEVWLAASKYVVIPFKSCGRDMNEGLDCYGLLLCVAKDLGITFADYLYEPGWEKKGHNYFIENYYKQFRQITYNERRAGDIVLFTNVEGVACHAGLLLSRSLFIHATRAVGVAILRLTDQPWVRKIYSYYRLKNEDHNRK